MTRKNGKKRDVTVSVNLTEKEKSDLKKFVAMWDMDMATLARRLIQSFLNSKVTLSELLRKNREESNVQGITDKTSGLRIRRISVRLTENEKEKLDVLANEGFYRPCELVRILLKLYSAGIIEQNDIWERR